MCKKLESPVASWLGEEPLLVGDWDAWGACGGEDVVLVGGDGGGSFGGGSRGGGGGCGLKVVRVGSCGSESFLRKFKAVQHFVCSFAHVQRNLNVKLLEFRAVNI